MEDAFRSLLQGHPTEAGNDLRFQFEVIKGLSESIRQQSASTERLAAGMADMQKTQVSMLERLAKLEANRVGEELAKLSVTVEAMSGRVNALESDWDQRKGASGVGEKIMKYWPAVAMLFTVLFLLMRATGILHLPDGKPAQVTAPAAREERDRIQPNEAMD